MARSKVDARPPSPILSTTESLPTVSGSERSSTGSKESPSTRPTSVSSNLSDPMEKPLYPIFTKCASSAQGLKRKFPPATKSSNTPASLQKESRPAKKTRLSPPTSAQPSASEPLAASTAMPTVSTKPRSAFLKTVLRDSPAATPPPETRPVDFVENVVVKEQDLPVTSSVEQLPDDKLNAMSSTVSVSKITTPTKKRLATHNKAKVRKSPRVAKMKTSVATKGRIFFASGKGKRPVRHLRERVTKETPKPAEPETKQRPAKKSKISVVPVSSPAKPSETTLIPNKPKSKKTWLSHGLYVGQKRSFDPKKSGAKNKAKQTIVEKHLDGATRENTLLPLPMFSGEQLLERGREFKLPFNVFNPLPRGQPKPDEWWKKQANRFVGDAAIEWKKTKPLPPSRCLCSPEDGCNEDCHNRYMLYECDETNCAIGPEFCTNRAFAELKVRRESGKKYDIGVEVLKTADKGFGVRACRTFEPNQVIVEYTGEIITQEECERRMREEYKDNECYYLMTFDQNMIIDATRGSIARFVNHSCAPNCRMTKWVVAGKPRMALFAGDRGIMTGEELTYDYNFDPFSQKNVQVCRCDAPLCRGVLGPKPSKEKEAKLKEIAEKAKKAVLAGTKRKLQGVLGADDDKAKPKPKKQKPKGTGIWAGKWEWAKA